MIFAMWIINTNTDWNGVCRTRSLKVPGMDEGVSFEDNPRQVSEDIGMLLIEECSPIEEYSAEN